MNHFVAALFIILLVLLLFEAVCRIADRVKKYRCSLILKGAVYPAISLVAVFVSVVLIYLAVGLGFAGLKEALRIEHSHQTSNQLRE